MPAYAGFNSFNDYVRQRLKRDGLSENMFCQQMGWRRNYINSILHGRFKPSPERCDKIASYFGDDWLMVRTLAGHQIPPEIPHERFFDQLRAVTSSMNDSQRRLVLRLAREVSAGKST